MKLQKQILAHLQSLKYFEQSELMKYGNNVDYLFSYWDKETKTAYVMLEQQNKQGLYITDGEEFIEKVTPELEKELYEIANAIDLQEEKNEECYRDYKATINDLMKN